MFEEKPKRIEEPTKMLVLSTEDKEQLQSILLKWVHEEGIDEQETSE